MRYISLRSEDFFRQMNTEAKARDWLWRSRFDGQEFCCPHCRAQSYYRHDSRPEVRTCKGCLRQIRLRAGTILRDSKLPILKWVRALWFVMQGKRGISALELKRQLGMKSYGTTWVMLQKIREALRQRDDRYQLKEVIELDGATFGKKDHGHEYPPRNEVFVAIESKDWVDEKGRPKARAGFAKICVKPETSIFAQAFVKKAILPGSLVNTDADPAYLNLKGVDHDYRVMANDAEKIKHWLPWVHKFISNTKTWLLGTHHRVKPKYLAAYLAEYTYRFNRRHDPNTLFHRALRACALAKPRPAYALFG
jgi:hypothetical protein